MLIIGKKIDVLQRLITEKNVAECLKGKKIGSFSIDIDGNDYWIVKQMIESEIFPELILVEYNPSFLDNSVTVPYENNFDRFSKHESGFYHGASLKAFYKLLNKFNYNLIKIIGGTNAIFVNNDLLKKNGLKNYLPDQIYQEGVLRNKWSNTNAKKQFELIKHLPFVNI